MWKITFRLSKVEKLALFTTAILTLYVLKEAFFQTSTLYSKIHWWIDPSVIPEHFLSKHDSATLVSEISEMLNDKKGWGSCGIDFQYTENKYKANILVYPVDYLGKDTVGITEWGLGYEDKCAIKLLGPTTCKSVKEFLKILNHEFGHALMVFGGLFPLHSKDKNDLMFRRLTENSDFFPNAKYIKKIKHRVLPQENKAF